MSPVFFVVYLLPLRRMPCTFLRKCRSGLRGSALSFVTVSDGKPCSGVRGSQQASTEQRGEVFARCARTRRLTADACGSLPLFLLY